MDKKKNSFLKQAPGLLLLLAALVLFLPREAEAARKLVIDPEFAKSNLKGILQVCKDPTGNLTIDQIASSALDECFRDISIEHPTFGYSDATFWFRIKAVATPQVSQSFFLAYDYPVIDEIDLYLPDSKGYKVYSAGDRRPFHLWPVPYRSILFPVTMDAGKSSTWIIRVKSEGSITVPITLWSEDAFSRYRNNSLVALWFFYGAMISIIFYNLLFFVSFREISYIFLSLFAISMTSYSLINNGIAFQYLWPDHTEWANAAHPFSLLMSGIWGTLFTRYFLNLKRKHPLFDYTLKAIGVLGIIMLATPFLLNYRYATQISMMMGLLSVTSMLATGSILAFRGSRPARFLIVSWIVFFIFMSMEVLRAYGVIPKVAMSDASLSIGTCAMILILSLGITDKINVIRREKDSALAALRESEEKYRDIFNNVSDVLYIHDLEGRFIDINRQVAKLGYTPDELKGKNIRDLIQEEHRQGFEEYLRKLHSQGSGSGLINIMTKDGSVRIMEFMNNLYYDESGRPVGARGSIRDVTERIMMNREKKDLEARLLQSRKMEALGMLAGGVAHDLNNILSAVVTYPELLLLQRSLDEKQRRIIKTIHEGGLRATAIVGDLLTIARGVAIRKESLDLNDVVREYLSSPDYLALKNHAPDISVTVHITNTPLIMDGSPIHLRKSLMNLLINAFEAVDRIDGKITVRTGEEILDKMESDDDPGGREKYIVLTVADNGHGIAEADLERIFEPFYSKKVMGRSGSGLGLAVVWNSVQDHNGFVDLKSSDKGTVFRLCFPAAGCVDDQQAPEITAISEYKGQGESILVIDDDPVQREIASHFLETLGYCVHTAASGEEAVDFVKTQSVDLLILDMIMEPGISGRETYQRITELYPKQKAIIVSGYADDDDVKAAQSLGAGEYVGKPYTLEKLSLAVRKTLSDT